MDMIGRIRRLHSRGKKSEREIARMTGLSRNTVAKWLHGEVDGPPKYRRQVQSNKLTPFVEAIKQALKADARRPRHERRTAKALYTQIKAEGYAGGYTRLTDFIRAWRQGEGQGAAMNAFVPLAFELGEAFQFDWSEAGQAGALGSTLHQLFQRAFSVAKEVRSATDIGAHSVSMSAAAVRLAQQLFGNLNEVRVLFVGAGEMVELAAAHFAGRKPLSMTVANRGAARGQALARRFGCESIELAELPKRLHEFDIVVSGTASTLPIIGLGAVESALKQRRHKPMFLADLAVPRDIEPEVARLSDVYLYTVDDLSQLVQSGSEKRQAAVAQAEAIVDAGVRGFAHWLEQRHNVPLIREVNARADAWRDAELARARRQLARGENMDAVLESLARGLTAKVLHGTLSELRQTDAEHRAEVKHAVCRLFLRDGSRSAAA